MRGSKLILSGIAASALLIASASSASAGWRRHHDNPGPVLGLVGGIVVGAVTIATLPLAIVGDAINSGSRPNYYDPDPYAYAPPQGDGYGYNYGDGGNYGPPRYYRDYAPPPRYRYDYGY